MEHTYYQDRLSAYHDRELPPEERQAVDEHLRECEDCRAELERLENFDRLVEKYGDLAGGDYWERSARRIEERIASTEQTEVTDLRGSWTGLGWKLAAMAATALVLTFVGMHKDDILGPSSDGPPSEEAKRAMVSSDTPPKGWTVDSLADVRVRTTQEEIPGEVAEEAGGEFSPAPGVPPQTAPVEAESETERDQPVLSEEPDAVTSQSDDLSGAHKEKLPHAPQPFAYDATDTDQTTGDESGESSVRSRSSTDEGSDLAPEAPVQMARPVSNQRVIGKGEAGALELSETIKVELEDSVITKSGVEGVTVIDLDLETWRESRDSAWAWIQQNVRKAGADSDRDTAFRQLLRDTLGEKEKAHVGTLLRASYHIARGTDDEAEREEALRTLRQGAAAVDEDIVIEAVGYLRSLEINPD